MFTKRNRCSDPCRRRLHWGERKLKAIVWQIFRERYPNQVLYFVKVNTNGKLETRTKGIVDKCSDLKCTKKYALTEGPKAAGGVTVSHSLTSPPLILCLLRACIVQITVQVTSQGWKSRGESWSMVTVRVNPKKAPLWKALNYYKYNKLLSLRR